MIDNYVNTLEKVQLYVYSNGQRVSADFEPTATAVDADTGDAVALSSVTTQTHADGYDYYEVSLDPTEITTTRKVVITWSYDQNTDTFQRRDIVNVVRPYFEADDFWSQYPEFGPGGASEISIDQIQDVERLVRMRIDRYCGQHFQDLGVKTKRVRGSGTNALQLNDRIYYLESLRSGDLTLFERDINGDPTTELVSWFEDEGHVITKKSSSAGTINYDDRTAIDRTRALFRSDRLYEVEAKFGWEYLPDGVHQAAIILANEELCIEDRYRKKNVVTVRSADYRMEFGGDHHTTTGNVDADIILSNYIYDGVFVL